MRINRDKESVPIIAKIGVHSSINRLFIGLRIIVINLMNGHRDFHEVRCRRIHIQTLNQGSHIATLSLRGRLPER